MADWYDRLISALGLDAHRLDRLLGGVEQELLTLSPPDAWRPLEVSLNRLMDGRRLLVFRVVDSDGGLYRFFPCSRANAKVLGDFLRRAESHLTPAGAPEIPRAGMLASVLDCLTPAQPVEVMAPLPDRHLETTIELRLLATRHGGHCLLFVMRGPGSHYRHRCRWSQAVAANWHSLLASAQAAATDWQPEAK